MIVACASGLSCEVDPDDRDPIWVAVPGTALTADLQLWRRLAVGLRCETWLGWSRCVWAPVLIKMARPHQCAEPRARQSLRREAVALIDLLHPTLPRFYDHDLRAEIPYLVEEYVDGPALGDLLPRRRVSPDAALTLAAQLLGALVPLHARGLAHLDIKPDNVIICDGRPVLVDFGSARPIGSSQPAGRPVGTLGYAGPDLEACEPVSAAMDVYGVGAVLRDCRSRLSQWPGWPAGPRQRRLDDVITRLARPDPADRPDVRTALDLVAAALPKRRRPWPAWAGQQVDPVSGWSRSPRPAH